MDAVANPQSAACLVLPAELVHRMRAWRRDIHAHPETAFCEHRTSDLVAAALQDMGLEVHRGLGQTGVVGTLRRGAGPAIGLRADMDALDIHELGRHEHRSRIDGKMHACGHDGHTAMLLGAAQYLAQMPGLHGTLHFIFQPAEEHAAGGQAMVEDGLFERFPCDAVYALHNSPNLPLGTFSTRVGAVTSSSDTFELTLVGKGAHAAQPEAGVDAVVMAAQVINALQSIVSRNVSAVDALIISVTQIHGGDAWNVIPEQVVLRGTCRSFRPATRARAEARLRSVCQGVALACGGDIDVQYFPGYPSCVNTATETGLAVEAARRVVGSDKVDAQCLPRTGSEDFAYMLQRCPGAYVFLGAARAGQNPPLHNPHYDFNDAILGWGASYWIELARLYLQP